MRAHLVQFDIAWEDKPESRRRALQALSHAAVAPGDLVVLPEMFETGFSMRVEATADDGSAEPFLADLARDLRANVLAGIVARGTDGSAYNRALLVSPEGRALATYDKSHPFMGAEARTYARGSRVRVVDLPAAGGQPVRLAPLICYDLRFPELFRACRGLGAEVFAVIANWPAARIHHWRALLIARAIENQAVVLGVNRVGDDPTLRYPGMTMAVSATGEVIAEAGEGTTAVSVDLPIDAARAWREKFPAWDDARAELLPPVRSDGVFAVETRGAPQTASTPSR